MISGFFQKNKPISMNFIICISLILFFNVGCARSLKELGTSIEEDGKRVLLTFTVGSYFTSTFSAKKDEDAFIKGLLEEELRKAGLCPDGYVIVSQNYGRHGDTSLKFSCK